MKAPTMNDQLPPADAGVLAALLAKFLPAGIGAALMMAVDPPEDRKEMFLRAFVAFGAAYLFGEAVFDGLQATSWFHWLTWSKRSHHIAVNGFVGSVGWFIAGAISMLMKRFRKDPLQTVSDARNAIRGEFHEPGTPPAPVPLNTTPGPAGFTPSPPAPPKPSVFPMKPKTEANDVTP
jgi:hypothetical protein